MPMTSRVRQAIFRKLYLGVLIGLLALAASAGCLSSSDDLQQQSQPPAPTRSEQAASESQRVAQQSEITSSPAQPTPQVQQQIQQQTEQAVEAVEQTVEQEDPVNNPQQQAATAEVMPTIYIVEPNDTLSKIAQDHNVSVEDLIDLNSIDDPSLLRVGQELLIPTGTEHAVCPNADEASYLDGARSIVEVVIVATDVLISRMDGATPAARGSGDWSGIVSAAVIDLSDVIESIAALTPPQSAQETHERIASLSNFVEDAVGPTLNFVMSRTNDSAPTVPKLQALADEATKADESLRGFCAGQGRAHTADDDAQTTACPDAAEEAYFAALNDAFGAIGEAVQRLTVLNNRLTADSALIRSSGWRFEVEAATSIVYDAVYAIVTLEQPVSVRYGLGSEAEWLAEDIELATGLYSLGLDYESPELMVEAGLEFLALGPRMVAFGEGVARFCE